MNKKYQAAKGFCVLDDTPCTKCGKCAGTGMRVTRDSLLRMADNADRQVQTAVFALNAAAALISQIKKKAPLITRCQIEEKADVFGQIYNSEVAAQLHKAIGELTAEIDKADFED